jgi:hypothetical protein
VFPETVAPTAGLWIVGAENDVEVGESLAQESTPKTRQQARTGAQVWFIETVLTLKMLGTPTTRACSEMTRKHRDHPITRLARNLRIWRPGVDVDPDHRGEGAVGGLWIRRRKP